MLILERDGAGDFSLRNNNSNESIIVPCDIARQIKQSSTTVGILVDQLYEYFGENATWRGILDNNLAPLNGTMSSDEKALLLEAFERLVQ